MFVRDVVIATPWVIALEVIGKSASILEKNQKCARVLEIYIFPEINNMNSYFLDSLKYFGDRRQISLLILSAFITLARTEIN